MESQRDRHIQAAETLDAAVAEQVPLRRDAVVLLQHLRDHQVNGTQSTGNLPLQAIREINAQLIPPMKLDERIGDHVYHLRSEDQVWRIYFPHVLASVVGLVAGGRARRLRVTKAGERFLASNAASQVWILLSAWWYRVNWMIAYPYVGLGKTLPYGFTSKVLQHLKRLPVEKSISFEEFADQLIKETRLTWTSADPSFHRMALHGAVGRMVIGILEEFGAIKRQYRTKKMGEGTIRELAAFQITPFGSTLLGLLE